MEKHNLGFGSDQNRLEWEKWWSKKFGQHKLLYKIWHFFLWKAYEKLLSEIDLNGQSQVLELGCGSGLISLYIAKKYGCKITLVDNSESAIALASEFFQKYNLPAHFLCTDMFSLHLNQTFDLVHSGGLIEHFSPESMKRIMDIHKNTAKKEGYIITFVPLNSFCYPLRTWLVKATKNWYFGHEIPLSNQRHKELYQSIGLKVIKHTISFMRSESGILGKRI